MSLPETYKALYSSSSRGGKPEFREVELEKPGNNQVLIKVAYAPIHRVDIYTMENFNLPDSQQTRAGFEGTGTIVAVGENLKYPFQLGDKVYIRNETYGQYKLDYTDNVFLIQEDLSLEEAAPHWANPGTAVMMTKFIKEGGHKAVVHTAGSSPIGRMMIKYFKKLGIPLINVVRNEEYVDELKKEGADYVLNSQDKNFEKDLKQICEIEKATIAFDPIGGKFTNIVLKALPNGSVIYVYGNLANGPLIIDQAELFNSKRIEGFFAPYFEAYLKEKGELRKMVDEVHSLLPNILSSSIQKVFKLEELDQALEYYYENGSKGKVLLKPN